MPVPLGGEGRSLLPRVAGNRDDMVFLAVGSHALLNGADFNASDLARSWLRLSVLTPRPTIPWRAEGSG